MRTDPDSLIARLNTLLLLANLFRLEGNDRMANWCLDKMKELAANA